MPMLAVIRTCAPSVGGGERLGQGGQQPLGGGLGPGRGRRRPRSGRRTRRRPAGRRCRSGAATRRRRSATATSSSSPAACPEPSLTALKSSRSTNSTATGVGAAVGAGQRVVEPVGEQRAVGQAGQRVVEGVVLQLGLELLLRGDVAGGDDDGADVGVAEQVGVDALHVPPAAVAVPQPQVRGRAGPSPGDGLGTGGEQGQPVLGMGEVGELRADQLVLRVAEEPGDRRRLIADREVGVDQGDQVGGVVHQRLEARLALRLGRRDAHFAGPAGGLEPAEQQTRHDRGEDHHEQGLDVGDAGRRPCWPPGAAAAASRRPRAAGRSRLGRRRRRRRAAGVAGGSASRAARRPPVGGDGGGDGGVVRAASALRRAPARRRRRPAGRRRTARRARALGHARATAARPARRPRRPGRPAARRRAIGRRPGAAAPRR